MQLPDSLFSPSSKKEKANKKVHLQKNSLFLRKSNFVALVLKNFLYFLIFQETDPQPNTPPPHSPPPPHPLPPTTSPTPPHHLTHPHPHPHPKKNPYISGIVRNRFSLF